MLILSNRLRNGLITSIPAGQLSLAELLMFASKTANHSKILDTGREDSFAFVEHYVGIGLQRMTGKYAGKNDTFVRRPLWSEWTVLQLRVFHWYAQVCFRWMESCACEHN